MKRTQKLNMKKEITQSKTCDIELDREFSKDKIQIATKHKHIQHPLQSEM